MTSATHTIAKAPSEKGRITGWHVLIGVVLFFATVIAVDIIFMVQAYRTFSGEVASNPYEAGLTFNRTLAQRQKEAALGWSASVETPEGKAVSVKVVDRSGKPMDGLSLTGVLERPATDNGRQTLNFRSLGGGRYQAAAYLEGAWDLRATARNAKDMFEIETRLVEPAQ
ncbi:FixH family protein [Caulobacter sp. BP25]|uniref:FixH family protein n=1 Tax=Caulobacter sp. BP25 TaxID=2048900 RepID=UPI000C12B738|nr:FixH family protein [Caulobacter sp. BP25]PHY20157.1 ferredoxin [Caulobacter sp. BP25]